MIADPGLGVCAIYVKLGKWANGQVGERWRGGEVERWRGGEVERNLFTYASKCKPSRSVNRPYAREASTTVM
jgi:hypothetical protein